MLQLVKIPDIVPVMAYRPAAWLGKLKIKLCYDFNYSHISSTIDTFTYIVLFPTINNILDEFYMWLFDFSKLH
jgi:hypothetical protein